MGTQHFNCKSCSAPISFSIEKQKWHCEYCDSEYEKDEISQDTSNYNEIQVEEGNDAAELDEYRCNACGAEILADGNLAATFCIYCQNSSIIKSRFEGKFKPKLVIPFKITDSQARELYKTWIRKRIFAPQQFRVLGEIKELRGLYAPYWLFDCHAVGFVEGEGRNVRRYSSGNYNVTETKHYAIKRTGSSNYEKVPVDGSENLPDPIMEGIEPFDYQDLKEFSTQYMAGHFAEKYDVDQDKASNAFTPRVHKFLRTRLENSGKRYHSVSINHSKINIGQVKIVYAMLPVYVLTNTYKNKRHTIIINGQTGKIFGEAPLSIARVIFVSLGMLLAIWLLVNTGISILYV